MIKTLDFKDAKILKPITILTLLYSVLMFMRYAQEFLGLIFKPKSPLIPEYLYDFIAFPSYFIVTFFAFIIFVCVRFLKLSKYNYKYVYLLFGLVFLFFIFQVHIYQFIMRFNPYG